MLSKFKPLPSQEYLLECLDYNPETGIFKWKERPSSHFKGNNIDVSVNKQRSGNIAGYIPASGYLMIGIDSTRYRAHRIAWKIVTGNDPLCEIDHIDMIRSNCKFKNLREAEGKENARNRKKYKNNKSGYKGVWFVESINKFCVQIMKDRVKYSLGVFDTAEEAYQAYLTAKREFHSTCTI